MKKILITGGAGFIGSHIAEFYASNGQKVLVLDNLSRHKLMGKGSLLNSYNYEYLKKHKNISFLNFDVSNVEGIEEIEDEPDVIFHTAAQTAVTRSLDNPQRDFLVNAVGTFNILEWVRKSKKNPPIVYCSTNKVYGENVNKIGIIEKETRYEFEAAYRKGVAENTGIDLCKHTPYGCSKLTGDLYMQDYAYVYGMKIGIFRMSCIYGPRQFGIEDQGWVAWFAIATLLNKPLTIYGDGKQVRDVLYVSDLLKAFDIFINKDIPYGVYNIGGGPSYTISLLELLDLLEKMTGKRSKIRFKNWRESDQRIYVSDIRKIREELFWSPSVPLEEGLTNLVKWIRDNHNLF